MCYIFLTILILQLKDTTAEADDDRNLINQKLLLSVFKSMGAYSKYAIEMFVSIAQIECMLTQSMSNIPVDKQSLQSKLWHHGEEQFDASVSIQQSSVQHTTRDSLKDEKEMVEDLVQLDP